MVGLGAQMTDRRRWPRYKVTWPVGLLVSDRTTIMTRAADASRHGVRLALSPDLAAELLRHGRRYRLEVYLPGSQATFVRLAEVRDLSAYGVGLHALEPLPEVLIVPPVSGRCAPEAALTRPPVPATRLGSPSLRALLARFKPVFAPRS
jgi:hypothetical protein